MTIIYPPTYQEFFDKVSKVDFLYSMSDAPGVFERGQKRVAEVRAEAESYGWPYTKMFDDWSAYKSSRVTGEDIAKPSLMDYAHE